MSAPCKRRFRRVLLIKPSSAGDVLHALPIARAIRGAWPDAHLAWLVSTSLSPLLAHETSINDVIPFDRKHFARVGRSPAITRDFAAFLVNLRRRRFDLVIDLQGLFRSGFMALATGASTRIGFRAAREFAWTFYTHAIPRRRGIAHAITVNLRMLDALGIPHGAIDTRPCTTANDEAAAAAALVSSGIGRAPYAVLVPSTRWPTKCWPPARFAQSALAIQDTLGLRSLLVGGPEDAALGQRIAADSRGAAVDLCGRTCLRSLSIIIRDARLVITADSMPMHLAAAHGVPTVALFGPTDPRRTGPYGHASAVLRTGIACSPCFLRRMEQCPHDHRCMQELDVDAVMRAARMARGGDYDAPTGDYA